jgi:hypothetical protein
MRSPQFYKHAVTKFSSRHFFLLTLLLRGGQVAARKEINDMPKPVMETDSVGLLRLGKQPRTQHARTEGLDWTQLSSATEHRSC